MLADCVVQGDFQGSAPPHICVVGGPLPLSRDPHCGLDQNPLGSCRPEKRSKGALGGEVQAANMAARMTLAYANARWKRRANLWNLSRAGTHADLPRTSPTIAAPRRSPRHRILTVLPATLVGLWVG